MNFGLILAAILICLLLMEAAVRIFMPQRVEKYINLYMPDEKFGWRLRPASHDIFTSTEFRVEIAANKNGFRDISHDYAKPDDIFRIVGIGDSFLFGIGTEASDNVLNILQGLLSNNSNFSKRIETINLGMPGYNINQYYNILKYEASKYSPDLVVLFFFNGNDWTRTAKLDFVGVNSKGYLMTERFSLSSVRLFLYHPRMFLKAHSHLYTFIRNRMLNFLRKTRLMYVPAVDLYKKDNNFSSNYSYTLEQIKEMHKLCTQQLHCRFALCIIPEKFQVDIDFRNFIIKANNINPSEYDWFQPQEALRNFCAKNNISFIDLVPTFSILELKAHYYNNIDHHWNKKGHEAVARELYMYIKEMR